MDKQATRAYLEAIRKRYRQTPNPTRRRFSTSSAPSVATIASMPSGCSANRQVRPGAGPRGASPSTQPSTTGGPAPHLAGPRPDVQQEAQSRVPALAPARRERAWPARILRQNLPAGASAATLDRLLRIIRDKIPRHGPSGTKPGTCSRTRSRPGPSMGTSPCPAASRPIRSSKAATASPAISSGA